MNLEFLKYIIFFLLGYFSRKNEIEKVPQTVKGLLDKKIKKIKQKGLPKGQILAPDPSWVNKSPEEREKEKYLTKRFSRIFKGKNNV